MTMPIDVVLVRHGESEGNIATKRSKKGDDSAYTDEFRNRHSSLWRLTDRGIEQARAAGDWVREHVGEQFHRYYTSEYLRAVETAAHLRLAHATWYLEFQLRERDWGQLDVMSETERRAKFADELRRKRINPFFWGPAGGESMAGLCIRGPDRMFDTFHRECADKRVIVVCHGEVMWAFRVRLERMSSVHFLELDASDDPKDHIANGQILHYTRRDPTTGKLAPHLNWMRSVCPWDQTRSRNEWEEITRPRYGNSDLLALAARTPRLIEG